MTYRAALYFLTKIILSRRYAGVEIENCRHNFRLTLFWQAR